MQWLGIAKIQCTNPKCYNEWYYKGDRPRACCPKCRRKINVEKNFKRPRKNEICILTDTKEKKLEYTALRPFYYKNGKRFRFKHDIGI